MSGLEEDYLENNGNLISVFSAASRAQQSFLLVPGNSTSKPLWRSQFFVCALVLTLK